MADLTYYLLRKKNTAVGDGPYLAFDAAGSAEFLPDSQQGKRFFSLESAETEAKSLAHAMGEFEIEIRNMDAKAN